MSIFTSSARNMIKPHSIDAPVIVSVPSMTYPNTQYTITSSPFVGHLAGVHVLSVWDITDVTNNHILDHYLITSDLNSVTFTLPDFLHAPPKVQVQYISNCQVVSPWSAFVTIPFEFATPIAPSASAQVYAVTDPTSPPHWSQWMNDHAVWIGPPGDNSTLFDELVSIMELLVIATTGTYVVQALADNGVRVVIDGFQVFDTNDLDTGFGYTGPANRSITLTAGTHQVVVTGYNTGAVGQTTWASNPGGFCCVVYDPTTQTTIFDLRNFTDQSTYYCTDGSAYSTADGLCHFTSRP